MVFFNVTRFYHTKRHFIVSLRLVLITKWSFSERWNKRVKLFQYKNNLYQQFGGCGTQISLWNFKKKISYRMYSFQFSFWKICRWLRNCNSQWWSAWSIRSFQYYSIKMAVDPPLIHFPSINYFILIYFVRHCFLT